MENIKPIDKIKFSFWQNEQLKDIVEGSSPHFKKYHGMLEAISLLSIQVHDDFQLYGIWRMHYEKANTYGITLDPFLEIGLKMQRQSVSIEIQKSITIIVNKIQAILDEGYFEVLPILLYKVLEPLAKLFYRLSIENLTNAKIELSKIVEPMFQLGSTLAVSIPDDDDQIFHLGNFAISYLAFINPENPDSDNIKKRADWSKELAKKINNMIERNKLLNEIDATLQQIDQAKNIFNPSYDPNTPPDWQYLEHMYLEQASALGIDLSLAEKGKNSRGFSEEDINANIAWIISLGIKDLNPNRILRKCKHIFIEYGVGGQGIPAQIMNLPSAGSKNILCLKHSEYGIIQGFQLDDIYLSFEKENCSTCKHLSPRKKDWEYTEAWNNLQKKKLENMRGK